MPRSLETRRGFLGQLTIPQLKTITKKYDLYIPSKYPKTGIISVLMSLPKSTLQNEHKKLINTMHT